MRKPSVFSNQQLAISTYDSHNLFKYRINQRYYFTEIILCEQKINLHVGYDSINQKQVLAASFLDKQQLKMLVNIPLKILWKGIVLIKRVRYYFVVMKKNGCFIHQALEEQQQKTKYMEWFFLILKLYVQYLFKNFEFRGSLNEINMSTMLFVINTKNNKIQLKYWNRIAPNKNAGLTPKKLENKQDNQEKKVRRSSFQLQKKTKDIWKRQQFRQALSQIEAIKKHFKQNQPLLKQVDFNMTQQIKNIISDLSETNKLTNLQDWLNIIQKTANSKNINLYRFQQQVKSRIMQISSDNQRKINKLCRQYNMKESDAADCEQCGSKQLIQLQFEENQCQQGVQQLMHKHILTPKFINTRQSQR